MELINFLISSKKSGYAANDERKELKFDDGSKGFQIESQNFTYIDRYYGFNPFCGSEKIFNPTGNLIWHMNYYGRLSENCQQPNEIYSFLREAMSKIDKHYPFRGPKELSKTKLKYENIQNGTIASFHGVEQIFENNNSVYVLHYHGGMIK